MNVSSHTSILKIVQNEEKLLFNVSEDPHIRSTILGNRRSSKQIFIGVSLFLLFLAKRKC